MNASDLERVLLARVGRPFVIEAVRMLEAGEGSVAGIDAALVRMGFRDGPFRRLDEVGLDVDLAIDHQLAAAEPMATRFDPPALQVRLVAEGRLGRTAGRGFYRYAEGSPPVLDVETPLRRELPDDAIVERLELGVINEAYRAVEDGLASPPAIDALMRGDGHPRGPFEIVDDLGMRRIIDRLRATHSITETRSGEQYVVATVLWQMATV